MPLIMVVDDSSTVRAIAQSFLERHQYQVLTAEDGLDALEKLKTEKPDLILLDIDMPRMNGLEFAEVLSYTEDLKRIPTIICTSRLLENNKQKALDLGVKAFIEKPFEEMTLINTIKGVLEEQ